MTSTQIWVLNIVQAICQHSICFFYHFNPHFLSIYAAKYKNDQTNKTWIELMEETSSQDSDLRLVDSVYLDKLELKAQAENTRRATTWGSKIWENGATNENWIRKLTSIV